VVPAVAEIEVPATTVPEIEPLVGEVVPFKYSLNDPEIELPEVETEP
jgi:hypothetical protein